MKNYYAILQLHRYASESEVKHAFRKLAFQFHPDKNPSPAAAATFREVNEAYEILSDPIRKMEYDWLLGEADRMPPVIKTHRDPRYRWHASPITKKTRREEVRVLMAQNLHYSLWGSKLAFLFSILLIIDFTLPPKKITTHVLGSVVADNGSSYVVVLGDSKRVDLSKGDAKKISSEKLLLYQSALLAVPLSLEGEHSHYRMPIEASIYRNFIFAPLALIFTSLAGLFYKAELELRFNLGVVNSLLLILNLVFLAVS